ncbi:MAG: hypothetical protein Q9202_007548 [Teloschistes flavicans]
MSTLTLPISSPNRLKRPFGETALDSSFDNATQEPTVTQPQLLTEPLSSVSGKDTQCSNLNQFNESDATKPDDQASSMTMTPTPATSDPSNPAKKRAKLTESEKETKRQEKEAKEKDKAEQKAKKNEEKRRKEEDKAKREEEKRVKDAEKEKKRLEKEEQAKVKEAEKKRKEEEKDKKQKSQLRLNAFFAAPPLANNDSTPSSPHTSLSPSLSRRGSVSSVRSTDELTRERSTSVTPTKRKISEYERQFPSFFLQSHTILAPHNRFERDYDGLQFTQTSLDTKLWNSLGEDVRPRFDPHEMLHLSPYQRRKLNEPHTSVKEIVERLNGSSSNPIDLTDPHKPQISQETSTLLKSVSVKILKFAEDIRPPYVGTYTRPQNPAAARKICRNPFTRGLASTDYDYDSEVEWEEPGEGEDLDSEGEEEAESEDGDDMDGFLDDEDTTDGPKRRLITSNLEAISTGICWEDGNGHQVSSALGPYRLEVILGPFTSPPKAPIDPYSVKYWQDPNLTPSSVPSSLGPTSTVIAPRIPLNPLDRTNHLMPLSSAFRLDGVKMQQLTGDRLSSSSKGTKRMVAPEVLEDFKRAVEGSDLTKAGLIEILKKQFPKQSKDAIKETLAVVAERVGLKEKDKKWMIKSTAL